MVVIKDYKELEIWNEAMEVCEYVYRITEMFPKKEQYTLVSQMRRACISIPANIAEGFVRKHPKEFRNFMSIALGSLAELDTHIILSSRLGYVCDSESNELISKTNALGRKMTTFYQGIRG